MATADDRLHEIFLRCDIDGDGTVDLQEIKIALANLGVRLSKDQIERIDRDNDGVLDYNEFLRVCTEYGILSDTDGNLNMPFRIVFKWMAQLIFTPLAVTWLWLLIPLSFDNGKHQNFWMFACVYHPIYVFISMLFGFKVYNLCVPIPSFWWYILWCGFAGGVTTLYEGLLFYYKRDTYPELVLPVAIMLVYPIFIVVEVVHILRTTDPSRLKESTYFKALHLDAIHLDNPFHAPNIFHAPHLPAPQIRFLKRKKTNRKDEKSMEDEMAREVVQGARSLIRDDADVAVALADVEKGCQSVEKSTLPNLAGNMTMLSQQLQRLHAALVPLAPKSAAKIVVGTAPLARAVREAVQCPSDEIKAAMRNLHDIINLAKNVPIENHLHERVEQAGAVMYSFTARNDDELTVDVDDVVEIIRTHTSAGRNWIRVRTKGKEGIVPRSYVALLMMEESSEEDTGVKLLDDSELADDGTVHMIDSDWKEGDDAEDAATAQLVRYSGPKYFMEQFFLMTVLTVLIITVYYYCQAFTLLFGYFSEGSATLQIILATIFPLSLKPMMVLMSLVAGRVDANNRKRDDALVVMRHRHPLGDKGIDLFGVDRRRSPCLVPLTFWMIELFSLLFYRNLFTSFKELSTFVIVQVLALIKNFLLYPGRMSPAYGAFRASLSKMKPGSAASAEDSSAGMEESNGGVPLTGVVKAEAATDVADVAADGSNAPVDREREQYIQSLAVQFFFFVCAQIMSGVAYLVFLAYQRYHFNGKFYTLGGATVLDKQQFERLVQYSFATIIIEMMGGAAIHFIAGRFLKKDVFRIGTNALAISGAVVPAIIMAVHVLQDVYIALNKMTFVGFADEGSKHLVVEG